MVTIQATKRLHTPRVCFPLAKAWHIEHVLTHLRQSDVDEAQKLTGLPAIDAVQASITASPTVWAMLRRVPKTKQASAQNVGQNATPSAPRNACWIPCAIFGVAPLVMQNSNACGKNTGIPWLVGTDDIRLCSRELVQLSAAWLARLQNDWRLLINLADSRNKRNLRWLTHAGFHCGDSLPLGKHGEAFTFFYFP